MHATDIIGWTADADYWCTECAAATFGPDKEDRRDSEGNVVAPIFASEETPAGASCGSCRALIGPELLPYVAIVNVPGYLPKQEDPPRFATAAEAWAYLAEDVQRDGESAWLPDDPEDPDGPASLAPWVLELERMAGRTADDGSSMANVGTVYGPTPGYDGDHDLGLAYSVEYVTED